RAYGKAAPHGFIPTGSAEGRCSTRNDGEASRRRRPPPADDVPPPSVVEPARRRRPGPSDRRAGLLRGKPWALPSPAFRGRLCDPRHAKVGETTKRGGPSMNKSELVGEVAERTRLTRRQAASALDAALEAVVAALKR